MSPSWAHFEHNQDNLFRAKVAPHRIAYRHVDWGLAPTHEEYREARGRCPVLIFVEQGATCEPAQREFLGEVQRWTTGHYTAWFSSADELRDAVTAALRDLELSRATGPVDEAEMLGRARGLLTDTRHYSQSMSLTLVVASGPRQQIVRPRELESTELEEEVTREALDWR